MIVNYIKHKNIDKQKWDICVDNAVNGLIYGKSFYLDNMASNWDGIVLGDYKAVMPIIWRSKWGIRYLYQPAFIQQGGIFYMEALSEKITVQFFDEIFKRFKFAEITGNYLNFPIFDSSHFATKHRTNFIINLNQEYAGLKSSYTFSCKRYLKQTEKYELTYHCSQDFSGIIELYKNLYKSRLSKFDPSDYESLMKVCKELIKNNNLLIRQVYDKKNNLACAVILLKHRNRLYNIINCVCPIGKQLKANYFLYDGIFREFAGQSLIFDFEGSDIEGIANFYLKFNPDNQPYPFIKFNNLNPILKLFKH